MGGYLVEKGLYLSKSCSIKSEVYTKLNTFKSAVCSSLVYMHEVKLNIPLNLQVSLRNNVFSNNNVSFTE